MSSQTANQLIERLTQPGALTAERFAALLGAPLAAGETNPFWTTHTFKLADGPFGRGELRLNAAGDGALLRLEPRDPPGLGRDEIDRSALGPSLGMLPNPDIPPEGTVSDYYQKDGVEVVLQWTGRSYRLRTLVLNWEPPVGAEGAVGRAELGYFV